MRLLSRAALPSLLALALAGVAPQAAGARPWTATYDWNASSTTGYENWTVEETAPDSGQPLPFYRTYRGDAPGSIGRGLAFQPLGGRVYDNGNPGSREGGPGVIARWNAPGQSRITRAVYGNTKYRNEGDGQYMRSRVTGADGHTVDYGPIYDEDDPDQTYINPAPPFDRTFTAGTTAEFWLFTVCGTDQANPGSFACPNVPAGTGTFARLGTVNLALDDPDEPVIAVESAPAIDDGWVNKRRTQRLTVTAADPSSGISRIRVQVRAGNAATGGRTLSDTDVTCDDRHRTNDRGGLVCPPTATATATDPGSSQTAGDRAYVVTAWDYAGNQSVTTRTVRRDTEVPSRGDASGAELRDLTDGWTNRVGQIPVRLTGEDSRAGVARLQLLARRVASGRATELADTATSCTGNCRRATETTDATLDRDTLPRDGRYRLEVRVTDRAGNNKTFRTGQTLKVDREAPRRLGPPGTASVGPDESLRLRFSPGRDAGEASGLGKVVVRYWPLPLIDESLLNDDYELDEIDAEPTSPVLSSRGFTARPARLRRVQLSDLKTPSTGGAQVRRLQRTLTIPNAGDIDPSMPVEVYVFDRAKGQVAAGLSFSEPGNFREDLIPIERGPSVPPGSATRPLPPRLDTGGPRWEQRNKKGPGRTNATRRADFPPNGDGGPRGSTPINPSPALGNGTRAPKNVNDGALRGNAYVNRGLRDPPGGSYTKPRPMMDVWARQGIRATGGRMRALTAQVPRAVRQGRANRADTKVSSRARKRVPLLGRDRNIRFDAKCVPLQAGHIIAAALGGFGDDPRNLVPLTGADNRGMRDGFETKMRKTVENNPRAMFVYYVRVFYGGRDDTYPVRFEALLEQTGGTMSEKGKHATKYRQTGTYVTKDKNHLKTAADCR